MQYKCIELGRNSYVYRKLPHDKFCLEKHLTIIYSPLGVWSLVSTTLRVSNPVITQLFIFSFLSLPMQRGNSSECASEPLILRLSRASAIDESLRELQILRFNALKRIAVTNYSFNFLKEAAGRHSLGWPTFVKKQSIFV